MQAVQKEALSHVTKEEVFSPLGIPASIASSQDALKLFHHIFKYSANGMAIVSSDGHYLSVNTCFLELLGYGYEDLIGRHFSEISHPEDSQEELKHLPLMNKQLEDSFKREKRFIHKNGQTIWVVLSVSNVYDDAGEILFFINQIFDISERKHMELELRKAKEEAERANRSKNEFLSHMSHELRTPLNAIIGFAELLDLISQDKAKNYAQHIHKAGKHLLEMINEVLDIARIETGGMSLNIDSIDLIKMTKEVCELVQPSLSKQNLQLHCQLTEEALYVQADGKRLKQVLINLLSNAIKYNKEDGAIFIKRYLEEGQIILAVEDTGLGILEEKLADVFMPFNRLGAEQSGIEGTGIGLTVSKNLVEAMGGKVWVESKVGEGTTFFLSLKQAEKSSLDLLVESRSLPQTELKKNIRLVYVEDNLANRNLMQSIIGRNPKMELLMANDGIKGLELIQQELPDLVLLDLHMPGLAGDQVLERLKASPKTASIPIIILSADATPNRIKTLKDNGAAAYLTKPLEIKQLLNVFQQVLSSG